MARFAAFISTNSGAVKDLFAQVLLECRELELITGEMSALDGCKLPANVSKEWKGIAKVGLRSARSWLRHSHASLRHIFLRP